MTESYMVDEADSMYGRKCRVIEGEKFKVLQRMSKVHVSFFSLHILFTPFKDCDALTSYLL